jgi:hypothetical protein
MEFSEGTRTRATLVRRGLGREKLLDVRDQSCEFVLRIAEPISRPNAIDIPFQSDQNLFSQAISVARTDLLE